MAAPGPTPTKTTVTAFLNYVPSKMPALLGRTNVTDKLPDVLSADPYDWKTYFHIAEMKIDAAGVKHYNYYDQKERAILKCFFLAVDDAKAQEKILETLRDSYNMQWANIAPAAEKKLATIQTLPDGDKRILNIIGLDYDDFSTYTHSTKTVISVIRNQMKYASKGDYKRGGTKFEISIKLGQAVVNQLLTNPVVVGDPKLANNIQSLEDTTARIEQKVDVLRGDVKTGLNDIKSEFIKPADLSRAKTFLLSPADMKSPAVQHALAEAEIQKYIQQGLLKTEQVAREAIAGEDALKRLIAKAKAEESRQTRMAERELAREYGKAGVFNPAMEMNNVSDFDQLKSEIFDTVNSFDKNVWKDSIYRSIFEQPRVSANDPQVNANSSISKMKEAAYLAGIDRKKSAYPRLEPVGKEKRERADDFMVQRANIRMSHFVPTYARSKFAPASVPKRDFAIYDSAIGAEAGKPYFSIDPEGYTDNKLSNIFKDMMFD